MLSEVPPLVCDPATTDEMVGYMKELPIPGLTPVPNMSASASEDFTTVSARIPGVFIYLSARYLDERGRLPPATRRFASVRMSAPSALPVWRTAPFAGRKSIPERVTA